MTTPIKALREVVAKWEMLDGNRSYSSWKVEAWLIDTMKPAIDSARAALAAAEKAEPVAWQYRVSEHDEWLTVELPLPKTSFSFEWRPLCAAPKATA